MKSKWSYNTLEINISWSKIFKMEEFIKMKSWLDYILKQNDKECHVFESNWENRYAQTLPVKRHERFSS